MIAINYKAHGVIAIEDGAMVCRHCVERLSDGYFAVVNVEFQDPLSDPETKVADTFTHFDDLNLTTDDEAGWKFFPTILEAVKENRESMSDYSEWMKRARNY